MKCGTQSKSGTEWMKNDIPDDIDESMICIDRSQENKDVAEFQRTGDMAILEKVYKNRIPTLKSWANKHFYPGLTISVEDLFSELSVVFVKAAQKYDRKRGSFNTCLFTFLLNRIKNIKNSKHAKKRISEFYDGPLCGMILSLDFPYSDKDGTVVTLKDVIPSGEINEKEFNLNKTHFEETLSILAHDSPRLKAFLEKVSEGNSLTALIKEYKTKYGFVKITPDQARKFGKKKCAKVVKELLKGKRAVDGDFKLLNYAVEGSSRLKYAVELKKTEETDSIMRTIRELRKNREHYMDKLGSN